jgi:uncharacterized protein YjiS (DUF1127 family)
MGQSRQSCPHFNPQAEADVSFSRKMLIATRRAWTCYWVHRAARATTGVLHALDDRGLKDIGLHRSEIESVAYGTCGRRGPRAAERRVGLCH